MITFYGSNIKSESIIYSVLEVINNSLRAHRENNISEKITSLFVIHEDGLYIQIKDSGGGFDPSILPYDINGSYEDIDFNGSQFSKYREDNGYLRFGMGLFLAKKTFSSLRLLFVDKDKNFIDWNPEGVKGTCIELEIAMNGDVE